MSHADAHSGDMTKYIPNVFAVVFGLPVLLWFGWADGVQSFGAIVRIVENVL